MKTKMKIQASKVVELAEKIMLAQAGLDSIYSSPSMHAEHTLRYAQEYLEAVAKWYEKQ